MAALDYDVVIVGSGFSGSVAALRAAEIAVAFSWWEGFFEPATTLELAAAMSPIGPKRT